MLRSVIRQKRKKKQNRFQERIIEKKSRIELGLKSRDKKQNRLQSGTRKERISRIDVRLKEYKRKEAQITSKKNIEEKVEQITRFEQITIKKTGREITKEKTKEVKRKKERERVVDNQNRLQVRRI